MPSISVPAADPGLPDYRALDLCDRILPGQIGVIMRSNDFAPHLNRGEVAIVDTTDKSLQMGELYVLRMNLQSPPHLQHLSVVELLRMRDGGLWYAFYFKGNGGVRYQGQLLRYVDGPLGVQHWPEKCLGRVVGYMSSRWEGRS